MTKSQAKRWLLDHYNDPENELMPQEETDDVLTALGYDVADLASGGGIESQGDMRWDVLSQEMMDAKKEFEDEEGEDEDSEEFGESVQRRASRMIESVARGKDANEIVEGDIYSKIARLMQGKAVKVTSEEMDQLEAKDIPKLASVADPESVGMNHPTLIAFLKYPEYRATWEPLLKHSSALNPGEKSDVKKGTERGKKLIKHLAGDDVDLG